MQEHECKILFIIFTPLMKIKIYFDSWIKFDSEFLSYSTDVSMQCEQQVITVQFLSTRHVLLQGSVYAQRPLL